MSADDGIRLKQLPDGKWVGYHYMSSVEENEAHMLHQILTERGRYPRYQNLDDAHQAYRDAAAETEYGFDIVWYHPEVVPSEEDTVHEKSFGQELTSLINRFSRENASGTPDFILARFLERQLWIFEETIQQRASWRNESTELPALQRQQQ